MLLSNASGNAIRDGVGAALCEVEKWLSGRHLRCWVSHSVKALTAEQLDNGANFVRLIPLGHVVFFLCVFASKIIQTRR